MPCKMSALNFLFCCLPICAVTEKDCTLKITLYTLRELIFAGTNFCGFCGFGPKPQNQVPAKFFKCEKQRSNNSQNGSNFLSSEKSAKLSSRKKSQNCGPQKLVPAKNSSLKVIKRYRVSEWLL